MVQVMQVVLPKGQFHTSTAYKKLEQLALNPLDLTAEGVLTPARIEQMVSHACGFKLMYGTERVTDEVMYALIELADERGLLELIAQMQRGAQLNTSEKRAVLHTATRDFFGDSQCPEASKKALAEVNRLKHFVEEMQGHYTDIVMVAIGGSDLGPRAHYVALEHLSHKPVHFISNIDPDDAAAQLEGLNLKTTLAIVVSKSGTTLETTTNEAFVREAFAKAGLDPKEHFIAVTSEGSPMDDPSKYRACFHMWEWVGGRFSTSSMGGGVMLALSFGFQVYWELLRGAHAMDEAALSADVKTNLPLLGALLSIWNHNFLHYPTLALIPYSQGLSRYAAHIQQVEMESNGKRVDREGRVVPFQTGPIIWGEPGTNAQHSFFQLIHQGTATIPLELIGFEESVYQQDLNVEGSSSQKKLLANLFAQAIALAKGKDHTNPNQVFPGNRPSHILFAKQLTPHSLGGLLSYYESKICFEGWIWGINSFDQEGVQLGKVLATRILEDESPLGRAFLGSYNPRKSS